MSHEVHDMISKRKLYELLPDMLERLNEAEITRGDGRIIDGDEKKSFVDAVARRLSHELEKAEHVAELVAAASGMLTLEADSSDVDRLLQALKPFEEAKQCP